MEKDLVAHRTVNVEATHRSSHLKTKRNYEKFNPTSRTTSTARA